MKSSLFSVLTKLTLTASVASVLVGCDEPEYDTPTPVTESTVGQARVLVVNAAPGTQGVTTTFENLPFGTVAPYLASPVGTYTTANAGQRLFVFSDPANIPATPAAATAANVAPLTAPRSLALRTALSGGSSYTVFLTDPPTRAYAYPVTATSDQGGIRSVVLTDNLAAPAANGAKIRFVNLSPSYGGGADSLGLFTTSSPSATGTTAPNRYLFAPIGRSYRSIAFTVPAVAATATTPARPARNLNFANFTDVPAGTYTFQVRRSATAASNPSQVIIQNTPLTFASGKIYTIYSRGTNASMSATPLGLTVLLHN